MNLVEKYFLQNKLLLLRKDIKKNNSLLDDARAKKLVIEDDLNTLNAQYMSIDRRLAFLDYRFKKIDPQGTRKQKTIPVTAIVGSLSDEERNNLIKELEGL